MWISHRKEIRKLTFPAQALRLFAPTKGLRSKRQLSNLFTVAKMLLELDWKLCAFVR